MAFGDASKKMAERKGSTTADGEQKVFESAFMPIGSGRRTFRILPLVQDGQVVLTPRLSPTSGQPLREGNKKTGAILTAQEPEAEVAFAFAWWEVMKGGEKKPARFIFAYDDYMNPLRKFIWENFGKDSKEAKTTFKTAFAINVYDKSPVFIAPDGKIWYQSESGKFDLLAYGDKGRVITDKDQLPEVPSDYEPQPLNRVRILEGSYGKPGGKHLFQQLIINATEVEDNDGMLRRLPEFTLRLSTTTGASYTDTSRMIRNLTDFSPVSDEIALLPRYDLKSWLTPWPEAAVESLIDGEDFNDVVEEYKLQMFPQLNVTEAPESELFD
jgi:hypothetical protein